ncbi:MAG: hypothetical protein IPG56_12755 [Caulobacteraceae bacterium]|nr:hypothetical protein [Caulobacteraceae bacterium]
MQRHLTAEGYSATDAGGRIERFWQILWSPPNELGARIEFGVFIRLSAFSGPAARFSVYATRFRLHGNALGAIFPQGGPSERQQLFELVAAEYRNRILPTLSVSAKAFQFFSLISGMRSAIPMG